MYELIKANNQLPANIEDLSRFVLIGQEKLNIVRAEIRAINKLGLATDVHKQKLQEAQELNNTLLEAEAKIGALTLQMEKQPGGDRKSEDFKRTGAVTFDSSIYQTEEEIFAKAEILKPKTKTERIKELGFNKNQISEFERMAQNPELVEQAKVEAKEKNEVATRASVMKKIKLQEKKKQILDAEQSIAKQADEEFKPVLFIGDSIGYVPDEKYDLLLTDPPYSTDVDNIEEFVNEWLYNALDNVKPTGFAYIFIGAYPEEQRAYLNAKIPDHISLCQELIWTYKNTLGNNPKDRYKQNYQVCLFYRGVDAPDLDCPLTNEQWAVQEINAPDGRQGDRYHAWQKPMEIGERFIRHSTQPGMTVFDPFACTGTFLLAAAKLGRKAFGFEINPENAKIAFTRGTIMYYSI